MTSSGMGAGTGTNTGTGTMLLPGPCGWPGGGPRGGPVEVLVAAAGAPGARAAPFCAGRPEACCGCCCAMPPASVLATATAAALVATPLPPLVLAEAPDLLRISPPLMPAPFPEDDALIQLPACRPRSGEPWLEGTHEEEEPGGVLLAFTTA